MQFLCSTWKWTITVTNARLLKIAFTEHQLKNSKVEHKIYFDTNADIYMALLQIQSTLLGPGLLILAMPLLNRPVRGLLPKLSRPPLV